MMSAAWLVAGSAPNPSTIAENESASSWVEFTTDVNAPVPLTSMAVTNSRISNAHRVQGMGSVRWLAMRRRKAAYSKPNSTPNGAIQPQPGASFSNTAAVCGAERPYKTTATNTIQ